MNASPPDFDEDPSDLRAVDAHLADPNGRRRINITISNEGYRLLLEMAGSEKKMGDFVDLLIRHQQAHVEQLLAGSPKDILGRLSVLLIEAGTRLERTIRRGDL